MRVCVRTTAPMSNHCSQFVLCLSTTEPRASAFVKPLGADCGRQGGKGVPEQVVSPQLVERSRGRQRSC